MRFAVLVIVALATVVYGQKSKSHPDTDKGNPAAEHDNAPNTAGQTVIVVNQQTPQGQQDDHSGNAALYLRELLVPANAPSLALVIVGIGGIVIAIRTLKRVDRQIDEMRQQREAMGKQVEAAILQVRAMQEQITQMEVQNATAKESADAAKVSADIAAGVSIPTLVVEKFELGNMGNANIIAILQMPKLNIVIRNHGKTPAFLHSWSLVLTCEELPPLPDYFGHPGSGRFLDKEVVQPDQPYTLPELGYMQRQMFSLGDVQAILDHKKMLSVYGYVCYRDIFGNPLKRLKFGEFALNNWDNGIEWCDMANPAYCGTDLYPTKGKGIKVEAEPANEEAN